MPNCDINNADKIIFSRSDRATLITIYAGKKKVFFKSPGKGPHGDELLLTGSITSRTQAETVILRLIITLIDARFELRRNEPLIKVYVRSLY